MKKLPTLVLAVAGLLSGCECLGTKTVVDPRLRAELYKACLEATKGESTYSSRISQCARQADNLSRVQSWQLSRSPSPEQP